METILEWPVWGALVHSLLHGLWQGGAISLVLFMVLKGLPAKRAGARYGAACGALLLLVVMWLGTWSWLERSEEMASGATGTPIEVASPGIVENFRQTTESVAVSAEAREARVEASATTGGVPWNGYVAAVWVVGVLLFQLRIFTSVAAARGLVRTSVPVEDETILADFFVLLDRFGPAGKVVMRESEAVVVPAVWGWLKPVLLVPPAFFTGMAPEQVEAVLAHELAHIRRHDFVVNLLQKTIEGVLFFNPFVWWISRQIRVEREACCDAEAVHFSGQPGAYAKALAEMAGCVLRQRGQPELVLSAGRGPGDLLERARRVLYPADRPQLGVSFRGAGSLILLCLAGLMLMKITAGSAIALLSPAERLDRFVELRGEYPDYTEAADEGEVDAILVSGSVRTAGGSPLPRLVSLNISSESLRSKTLTGVSLLDGADERRFSNRVPGGEIYVTATAAGYAPAVAGPLDGKADLPGIELILDRGHTARIRFTDPTGRPVANAAVSLSSALTSAGMGSGGVSDEMGVLPLENLGDFPLRLSVKATGFQTDTKSRVRLSADEVIDWVLQPAAVTTGTIVFAGTGEPVPGARVHLAHRSGPNSHNLGEPRAGNLEAEADAEGRFELNTLHGSVGYYVTIVAEGAGLTLAGPIRAGDTDLRFELPRARYLEIHAVNVGAEDLDSRGRLQMDYRPVLDFGGNRHVYHEPFHAVPVDGRAEFVIGPLWGTEGEIGLRGWKMEVDGRQDLVDEEPVVVDLRAIAERDMQAQQVPDVEEELRPVEIVLKWPSDSPPPQGALLLEYVQEGQVERHGIKLIDGRARTSIPVARGGATSVELLAGQLVGYWFSSRRIDVPAGDSMYSDEIALLPAGAIHGKVLGPDGEPASGILISVVAVAPPPGTETPLLGIKVKTSSEDSDGKNRFLAGPLPIGGTYYICAYGGTIYTVSEPITLTEAEPFREVTLMQPEGIELSATILGPDGTPFTEEPATFRYSPVGHHGFGGAQLWPGRDGRVVIEKVNPSVPGYYELQFRLKRDYQPMVRRVVPGLPEVIQLRAGLILEGRVVNAVNGEPESGVEVYALREWRAGVTEDWHSWFDAEGPTDDSGSFRFSNLPQGELSLHVRGARVVGEQVKSTAGDGKAVVLAVERY